MQKWDANRANEIFIQRSQARNPERYLNKPKHEAFDELRLIEEAIRDVNRDCAKNCWQKVMLLKFLDMISPSTVSNKPDVYAEAYISEAKSIKELILSDKLF